MTDESLHLENLAESVATNSKAAERQADIDQMTVELRGFVHKGKVTQLRVMLDNHREQRRLTTSAQRAEGVRNRAQVAWLFLDGKWTWLRGYAWTFDEERKCFGGGRLTEDEQVKIQELANVELERILPQVKEHNEKHIAR